MRKEWIKLVESRRTWQGLPQEMDAILWASSRLDRLERVREAAMRVIESATPYKAGGLPLQEKIYAWTRAMDDLHKALREVGEE